MRTIVGLNTTDKKVLECIENNPMKHRDELSEITGIPRSTIYDSTRRLLSENKIITRKEKRRNRRGRSRIFYDIGVSFCIKCGEVSSRNCVDTKMKGYIHICLDNRYRTAFRSEKEYLTAYEEYNILPLMRSIK